MASKLASQAQNTCTWLPPEISTWMSHSTSPKEKVPCPPSVLCPSTSSLALQSTSYPARKLKATLDFIFPTPLHLISHQVLIALPPKYHHLLSIATDPPQSRYLSTITQSSAIAAFLVFLLLVSFSNWFSLQQRVFLLKYKLDNDILQAQRSWVALHCIRIKGKFLTLFHDQASALLSLLPILLHLTSQQSSAPNLPRDATSACV